MKRKMRFLSGSGTRRDCDVTSGDFFTTFRTGQDGIKLMSALNVIVHQRPPLPVDHVDIAPMDDRHDDRIEIQPLVREPILVPNGALLIGNLRQNEMLNEFVQPVGQDRPSDAEACVKILKSPHLHEAITQDHQSPAIANDR